MIKSVNKMSNKCPNNTVQYVVKSGDTLYKIATRNKTTIEVLLELNPELNTNLLIPGVVMCVPANMAVPPTTPPGEDIVCPDNELPAPPIRPIAPPSGTPTRPMTPPSGMPTQPIAPPSGMPTQPMTPPSGMPTQPIAPPSGMPTQPIAPPPGMPTRPMTPPPGMPMQPMTPPSGMPTRPMTPPSGMPTQPMTPPSGMPMQPMTPPNMMPTRPMTPPSMMPTEPMTPPSMMPTRPMTPPSMMPTQPMTPPSMMPTRPTTPPSMMPTQPMTPPSMMPIQPITPPNTNPMRPMAPQTNQPNDMGCMNYTIKHGDTLYNLARKHNISLYEMLNANKNINPYNLQVGQVICIPMSANRCPHGMEYTVVMGDTLASILTKFRISLANLKEVNEHLDPYNLRVGTKLCIPAFEAFDDCPSERTYVIRTGDNLNRISQSLMISTSDLLSFNPNMRPDDFSNVGTTICIPPEAVPFR